MLAAQEPKVHLRARDSVLHHLGGLEISTPSRKSRVSGRVARGLSKPCRTSGCPLPLAFRTTEKVRLEPAFLPLSVTGMSLFV
jgi:hypothetical protein